MKNQSDLQNRTCKPCEGGMPALTREEIKKYSHEISGWNVIDDKKLEKDFQFKNFKQALAFINKVGDIAESEGHHPDIFLHNYRKVKISLWTHAVGGLSDNDFIIAAKVDAINT